LGSRRFPLRRKNFRDMEAGFAIFPHHGSKFSIAWKPLLPLLANENRVEARGEKGFQCGETEERRRGE
ncbi:MAG: hypothetical protein J6Y19_05240, partial [Kiritimatiellae bacterium]|nr:hypothetical protein [Kiritimatiellia bacterium]